MRQNIVMYSKHKIFVHPKHHLPNFLAFLRRSDIVCIKNRVFCAYIS